MTDAHWQALCQAMGCPAWTQDERFATLLGRKAHEDELDARLGAWTQGWEAEALMHALQQAGVPAGVVHTNRGVIEDAQLQHRGHFVYFDHPGVGRHPVQRSEFRLSQAIAEHRWAAPLIGQHTAQVCKEILDMSEDEIATLMAEGVLEHGTLPEGGAA
jgi:crotonobetainyl-CoA:carnitine CoA-transferase CaiB-like acyl-CoA transferase